MPLDEWQLAKVLLSVVVNFALFALIFVAYQLHQLGNGGQETGRPVEKEDDCRENEGPGFPTQETQEPGVHQSMQYNAAIKEMKENLPALHRVPWAVHVDCQQLDAVRDQPQQGHDDQEQGCCSEALTATSSTAHELANNSELSKEEPEAINANSSSSDEHSSASGISASAFVPSANPNKKKQNKKKKKKKSKGRLNLVASQSSDVLDAVDHHGDPHASTDESHHSAIETFSSGIEPVPKPDESNEPMKSEEAACPRKNVNPKSK